MNTATLIERIHRHDYGCIGVPAGALTLACVRSHTLRRLTKNGQTVSPYLRLALEGRLPVGVVGGWTRPVLVS